MFTTIMGLLKFIHDNTYFGFSFFTTIMVSIHTGLFFSSSINSVSNRILLENR